MADRLTEAQVRALNLLPISVTMWGGKPFTGLPRGVRSVSTLEALRRRGLCKSQHTSARVVWSLTPAGRRALEQGGRE